MSEPVPPKSALRRHFRQRRLQQACSAAISAQLVQALRLGLVPEAKAGAIGLYHPLAGEADLLPLPSLLGTDHPWTWALPAVLPPRNPSSGEPAAPAALQYLPWRPGDQLMPDGCGIPAPSDGSGRHRPPLDAAALALLLVPGLAVDSRGIRLGSGGGWYDRLRADPTWRRIPALVVLPDACVCQGLPQDPWDVPFDGWLTETGLYRP